MTRLLTRVFYRYPCTVSILDKGCWIPFQPASRHLSKFFVRMAPNKNYQWCLSLPNLLINLASQRTTGHVRTMNLSSMNQHIVMNPISSVLAESQP